jgi:sucrose-6-phosphate hydrolase SacC (GH32 family)
MRMRVLPWLDVTHGVFMRFRCSFQAIPRTVWLDPSGKQLVQWPIEEVEALRGKSVTIKNRVIRPGQHVEVTGLQTAQVCHASFCSPKSQKE